MPRLGETKAGRAANQKPVHKILAVAADQQRGFAVTAGSDLLPPWAIPVSGERPMPRRRHAPRLADLRLDPNTVGIGGSR